MEKEKKNFMKTKVSKLDYFQSLEGFIRLLGT